MRIPVISLIYMFPFLSMAASSGQWSPTWTTDYQNVPLKTCDSILVGNSKQDSERGSVRFSSLEKFLNFKDDGLLNFIIASLSCVVIKAQLATSDDIEPLVEFVNRAEVPMKHLVIGVPIIQDNKVFQKQIMNYNAMIYHNGSKMTSLCPTLGKKYVQIHQGFCPLHLQKPANKELKIFFIGAHPFVKYPKDFGKLGGSEFLVMKLLAKKHKFTPHFLPAKSFDIVETNGTKHGLMHQVSVKNCEIGMAQITFDRHRYQHVDYLPWMYFYEFVIAGRKPLEISSFMALVYPLDFFTWIFSLIGTIMIFLTLLIMQKLWSHVSGEAYFPEYLFQDFCLAILWIDETVPHAWFSRSGFTHARKGLLLLWLFAGSFILMGYKSTLLSSLTMIDFEDKFATFHDLDKSGIPLAFHTGTILDKILSTDPRPIVQRMYKNAISYPYRGGLSPRWVLDKVNEGSAFYSTTSDEFKLRVNDCPGCTNSGNGFYMIKEKLKTLPSSYIVPKGSPLMNVLKNTTMWLRETGVLGKMKDDELSAPKPIPDLTIKVNEPIYVEQLGIGIAIYSVGMVLSLLFFIIEFCTKRAEKK